MIGDVTSQIAGRGVLDLLERGSLIGQRESVNSRANGIVRDRINGQSGDIEEGKAHDNDPLEPDSCSCMHITAYVSIGVDGLFFVAGVVMVVFGSIMISSGSIDQYSVGLITVGAILIVQSLMAGGFTYLYTTLLPLNEAVERLNREVEELNQANETYMGLNTEHERQIELLTGQVAEQKELLIRFHDQLSQFVDTNEKIANTAADMAATEESFQAIAIGLDKGINILKDWGGKLAEQNQQLSQMHLQAGEVLAGMLKVADRENRLVERMAVSTAALEHIQREFEIISQKRTAVGVSLMLLRRLSQKKIDALFKKQEIANRMLDYIRLNNPGVYQKASQVVNQLALTDV